MRWQVLPDDQIKAKRRGVSSLDCRKASFAVGLFFMCQNVVENWISSSDENHAKGVTSLNSDCRLFRHRRICRAAEMALT